MIQVVRLAHVALRTAQFATMEAYLVRTLGLWPCQTDPDGTVHFTGGGAGAWIELIPGDAEALDHVALELGHDADLATTTAALAASGVEATPWIKEDPCAAAALAVSDPEGGLIQLVLPSGNFVEEAEAAGGICPLKLGHVATKVTDAAAMQRFYQEQLGFRWSDSIGEGFVFLRCSADHHAVNFLEAGEPGAVHHIAFELQDFSHTQRAMDRLAQTGGSMEWGPGRHGPGHNLFTYHLDPDGHIIELFAGIDRMSDERQGYFDPRPWHQHRPQRPAVWDPALLPTANSWGIAPPDTFMD